MPDWTEIAGSAEGLGMIGALFLVNCVALFVGTRLRHARQRLLSIGLLAGLLWGTSSQFLMVVGGATAIYWLAVPKVKVPQPRNPDPENRLETEWDTGLPCCFGDPRWPGWTNATLQVWAWLLGPSPNAYTGPYPSQDEAQRLLDLQGDRPVLHGDNLVVNGKEYPLVHADPMEVAQLAERAGMDEQELWSLSTDSLSSFDVRWGRLSEVAYLSDSALLVRTEEAVELRVWRPGSNGTVWATWPTQPMP